MKKTSVRILCSALAALLTFGSVSTPSMAADYSALPQTEEDNSTGSVDSDGFEDLKKQIENLVEEGNNESSEPDEMTTSETDSEESVGESDSEDEESSDDGLIESEDVEEDIDVEENSDSKKDQAKELLQSGQWTYYLDEDDYAHIAGYANTDIASLFVPKKLGKHYVTAIEEGAFADLTNLSSISIPFYTKSIDSDVFGSDVTIKAYHGTAAASFAEENGYSYINLSELDFVDNVIDLTEIYRAHYSRIAELEFEFDKLEASYLEEGAIFYLAPSDEVPNGDIYKVITKEENGDSVTLRVERSVGKEALNSLHIDEENLKPDWYTAVYYNDTDDDGLYEEYTLSDLQKVGDEYLLKGFGRIQIDKNPKFGLSCNINKEISIKDTTKELKEKYGGTLPPGLDKLPSVKAKVKVTGELDMEKSYSVKADIDFLKAKINRLEYLETQEVSHDFTVSGSAAVTIPIAKYSVPNPGLFEITAEADLVIDCSGKISVKVTTSGETGIRYVGDGKFADIRSCDSDRDVSISGTYKVFLKASVKMEIPDVTSMELEYNLGIKMEIADSLIAESLDATFSVFSDLKFTFSLSLFGFIDHESEITFASMELILSRSTLESFTVEFMTGKTYAAVPSQTVVKGGFATEPDTNIAYTNGAGKTVGIEGWYKDPSYRERFDFENTPITENVVIYGKTVPTHKVTLNYSVIGCPDYTFEAPEGKPLSIDGTIRKMEYIFSGFYKDEAHTERWSLVEDVVPDHDITLYANYTYQKGYNPWNNNVLEGVNLWAFGIPHSTNDFEYNIFDSDEGKYAVITGYKGNSSAIAIPTMVNDANVKVKSVSTNAFKDNLKITSVVFPNGVTLETGILEGCINVRNVKIEDVVFEENDRTFEGLKYLFDQPGGMMSDSEISSLHMKLKKVILGGDITKIRYRAFCGFNYLEEVEYPNTVTEIGIFAFSDCDGLKTLPITEYVTKVGELAFSGCDGITSIDIPDGVRYLDRECFSGCSNVTEVHIPNEEIEIYYLAFKGLTKLTEIVIPDKAVCYNGAFNGCTGVESVTLPDVMFKCKSWSPTGLLNLFSATDLVFVNGNPQISDYPNLKKVTLTGKITEIRGDAFYDWTQLEEINYPNTVTKIDHGAFSNCDGLKTLPISDNIREIEVGAFRGCDGITTINIPNSVKKLAFDCFSNCSNVTKITIPDNGIVIRGEAFGNLTKLTEIEIPNSATCFESAFKGCTGLESVTLPDLTFRRGNYPDLNTYGFYYLFGTYTSGGAEITDYPNLKKVTLTGNITGIGFEAFRYWTQLEEVNYPDSVTKIGPFSFYNCDGIKTPPISENITEIGSYAFGDCDGLTVVDIPNSVKSLDNSFSGCSNLTKISLPDNGIILNGGIRDLPKLKEIVIPDSAVYYQQLLDGCKAIESVTLPSLVFKRGTTSEAGLFYLIGYYTTNEGNITDYPDLKKVTITGDITRFGYQAFKDWTQLEEINYSDTVKEFGYQAFLNCSSLKRIVIPSGVTKIDTSAFTGCTGLEEILVYADDLNISSIPIKTDENGNGITKVYGHVGSKAEEYAEKNNLPFEDIDESFAPVTYVFNNGANNITRHEKIGQLINKPSDPYYSGFAFNKWYFDEGLTVPWDFEYDLMPACGITLYADWRANSSIINNFTYEDNGDYVTITGYVGRSAGVIIPDKIGGLPVKKLGDKAFAYDKDISSISIPKTVEEIAESSFIESPNLKSITVSSGNEYFTAEDGILFNRDKSELILYPASRQGDSYAIPDTVSKIWGYAFANSVLKEITCNEGLEEIGEMAFAGCEALEKVTLSETVNTFGSFVFWNSPLVQVYGPMDNADIEEFIGKELVDYNLFTLTFVTDGETCASYRIKAGETLSDRLQEMLSTIGKMSYELAAWTVQGDDSARAWDFEKDTMPMEDVTLAADWRCVYSYTVEENKVTLTGTGIDAKDYILPEAIDGYEIVGIAEGAFARETIESVTIPATITEIADGAFHSDATIIADDDSSVATYATAHELDFVRRTYAAVFNSNGGTDCGTRYYAKGSKVVKIPNPIKDNNNFRAWYVDEELTTLWDFETDTMPGESITLYAGWNKIDANIEDDVFAYEKDEDGKLTITGYTGKSSFVKIPETINGYLVTAIGEYAFAFNEAAAQVLIPDTVTVIESKAFYNCQSLEKIIFGKNVETLGSSAFAGCGSLNRIDLTGTEVKEIPDSCFMQAVNLYYVTLPDSIVEIGDSSFAGCTYLQAIELPSALGSLGRHAFYNDKVLKELTIPAGVVSVGEGFADGCSSLKEIKTGGNGEYKALDGILYHGNTLVRCPEGYAGDVVISDNTEVIEKEAFYGCSLINSVALGKNVRTIRSAAFSGCRNMQSFRFAVDNRVTSLGSSVFYGCSSLSAFELPDEIASIGRTCFAYCTSLETITIGENVTSIGESAFFGDDGLTIRGYADSAIDKYALKNKDIKFEYIADKAFTPGAPEAESVVNTTITLKATEGYEYKMNDGEWQASNVFSGLAPVTAYFFYQRVAESPYAQASNSSEAAVIRSGRNKGRSVKIPVIRAITSSSVTVAALEGCEYSIDGVNFQADPKIINLRANTQYTVYQRAAETAECDAGEAAGVSFTTPAHTGSCTVIFDFDGGSLDGYDDGSFAVVYENGELVADPGVPERRFYKFDGWYYGTELYDFAKPIDNDVTLKAGWTVHQQVQTPFANVDGSEPLVRNSKVYLATKTVDARIYYTMDGSVPTTDSGLYDEPIIVTSDVTIRAIAVKEGSADSEVMTLVLAVNAQEDLGDVAEDDIPTSEDAGQSLEERIPEGLWVAGLEKEMPYTGSAVKQQLRVYNNMTLLTEKKDYKLTYKNNTKAGTATVTVTGTGSYSGSLKLDFVITPVDIEDDQNFRADDIYVTYNKKAQKPSAVLYQGSKKLASGKDYTVSWTNDNGKANTGCTAAGEYEVTLTGKGNYKGSRTLTFHVTESTLISKVTLKAIKAQDYTGEAVYPDVVLTDKKYTLVNGTDYRINWPSDCTSVGNVTLTVEGLGKYAGIRTATFAIKGTAIKSASVSGIASSYGYEGEAIEPAGPSDDNNNIGTALLTITDSKTKVKTNLVKGRDFTVSYKNNSKAGTATAVFTGTGRYTGTVSKTFKIAAYSMAKDVDNITAVYDKSVSYVKDGVKPHVSVYFRGIELTEGTDYTVNYANNNAVTTEATKKLPSITIKGKGNFAGSYKALNFSITRQDISGMNISVSDKIYVNKAKAFKSTPVITDASNPSAKLVAGKDYNKNITYRYEEDVRVTQVVNRKSIEIDRKRGDIVEDADILPVGAVVRAEVTGMGNYEGILTACYKIMKTDIAKATVKVKNQTYTGLAVEPGKDQISSIKIGKTVLTKDDYEIAGYSGNEKVGTATMIIRGRGIYGGTKKVTFKITKKSF